MFVFSFVIVVSFLYRNLVAVWFGLNQVFARVKWLVGRLSPKWPTKYNTYYTILYHDRPSSRQHPSYGDCLEVKREYYQNCSCWIVWHNVHSQQHTYVSSSYWSNRLCLSRWHPYAVCRGGCLELYYCNMVEWFWWDSSLISTTNWFPSVLWHCCFGHLACKNRPRNDLLCVKWDIKPYTLTHSLTMSVAYPKHVSFLVWPVTNVIS